MKVYCPILQTRLRVILLSKERFFPFKSIVFKFNEKDTHFKCRKNFTFQRLMMRTPVSKVPIKVTPEK